MTLSAESCACACRRSVTAALATLHPLRKVLGEQREHIQGHVGDPVLHVKARKREPQAAPEPVSLNKVSLVNISPGGTPPPWR